MVFLIAQVIQTVSKALHVAQVMVFVTGARQDLLLGSIPSPLMEVPILSSSLTTPTTDNLFFGVVTSVVVMKVLAVTAVRRVAVRLMEVL